MGKDSVPSSGDATKGAKVFKQKCSQCHTVNKVSNHWMNYVKLNKISNDWIKSVKNESVVLLLIAGIQKYVCKLLE